MWYGSSSPKPAIPPANHHTSPSEILFLRGSGDYSQQQWEGRWKFADKRHVKLEMAFLHKQKFLNMHQDMEIRTGCEIFLPMHFCIDGSFSIVYLQGWSWKMHRRYIFIVNVFLIITRTLFQWFFFFFLQQSDKRCSNHIFTLPKVEALLSSKLENLSVMFRLNLF